MHDRKVEESRLKRKNREVKRASPYDRGTSKSKFEIQYKANFKKRFSNQDPPNVSNDRKEVVSNSRSQWEKGRGSTSEIPQYTKCGNMHMDKCLMGTNNFFGCG